MSIFKLRSFKAYFIGLYARNYKSESRRRTPWTGNDDATPVQRFIDSCNTANYDKKHHSVKDLLERELLDNYQVKACRHCGSKSFQSYGKTAAGTRRYYCNDCRRTFTILTNTIFDQRKIPISEWLDLLLSLMGNGSFSLTSASNRNAMNTTKYWFRKVFSLLTDWQDSIMLEGGVYLDETYYSVISSEQLIDSDGTKPRGLSCNKICIGVASDGKNTIAFVEGKGKPSKKHTLEAFGSHIAPGSLLIHDGDISHSALVERLRLIEEIKELNNLDKLLLPINQLHVFLKRFLSTHPGSDRALLQDYLNFFCFVSRSKSKFEKVEELMEIAFQKSNILRYRC